MALKGARDQARHDDGTARLQGGTTPFYQMVIVENPDNSNGFPNGFTRPGNSIGALTNSLTSTPIGTIRSTLKDWGSATVIQPANKGTGPNGFYVVGPKVDFQNGDGSFTSTLQSDAMNVTVSASPDDTPGSPTPPKSQAYGIYLQRLACPGLPPQDNPGAPYYNPYITVDYIPGVNPNYAFTTIKTRPQGGSSNGIDIKNRASAGRARRTLSPGG